MTVLRARCRDIQFGFSARGNRRSVTRAVVCPVGLTLLISLLAVGCGGERPGLKRVPISGKVTREGHPIDSGTILMAPASGGPGISGQITNGEYRFTLEDGPPAGKYKVTISAEPNYDKTFKGRRNEAPILPDDRFKKKMPKEGWKQDAEVSGDPKQTIDFAVDQ